MAKKYDEDAFSYLSSQLKAWGLSSLTGDVQRMLTAGASPDRIQIELQETDAYKKRFAGNAARVKKGLAPLAPDQYLAVEASYRQVMQAAGLPPGFYDQPNDFRKWIEGDVAPAEVQGRVTAAQSLVESADPKVRSEFERMYGTGNIIAYALDPKRTQALIEKQAEAARLSSAAIDTGWGGIRVRGNAERLVEMGVGEAQARAGFMQAKRQMDSFGRLGGIYAGDYSRTDAFEDVFFSDADAAEKRTRLASQERAAFSGRRGVGDSSLSRRTSGNL